MCFDHPSVHRAVALEGDVFCQHTDAQCEWMLWTNVRFYSIIWNAIIHSGVDVMLKSIMFSVQWQCESCSDWRGWMAEGRRWCCGQLLVTAISLRIQIDGILQCLVLQWLHDCGLLINSHVSHWISSIRNRSRSMGDYMLNNEPLMLWYNSDSPEQILVTDLQGHCFSAENSAQFHGALFQIPWNSAAL